MIYSTKNLFLGALMHFLTITMYLLAVNKLIVHYNALFKDNKLVHKNKPKLVSKSCRITNPFYSISPDCKSGIARLLISCG